MSLRFVLSGFVILTAAFLSGCATESPSGSSAEEWGTRTEYHALLSPKWKLNRWTPPRSPLYVVGIEKLSKKLAPDVLLHRIEDDPKQPCLKNDLNCLRLSQLQKDLAADIRDFVVDSKVQWPTHIARIQSDGSACALFSIYAEHATTCDAKPYAPAKIGGVWNAFEQLSSSITQHIEEGRRDGKPVSHLVLLVTGWNTFQNESAANFADWALSLGEEGPAGFNPIYVGISWESTWGKMEGTSGAVLSVLSFANKGNDADEIGFTWANHILNRYIMRAAAANNLPVLVIGHSFGARITAAALHGGSLLRDLEPGGAPTPVTFVALQPAFSSNRLRPGRTEAFYTTAMPPIPGSRSFYTASVHDKATAKGNAFWGWLGQKPYISSPQVVKAVNSERLPSYLEPVEVWKAVCSAENCNVSGALRLMAPSDAACSRVPLIDATPIIKAGDTASGAHSDVYGNAVAQLIFRAVEACAH